MGTAETAFGHRLDEVECLASLSRSALARVARLGVAVRLEPDRVLWREGDWHREGVLIVAGQVDASACGCHVARFGPGSLIAVRADESSRGRQTTTVRAATTTTALVYTRQECDSLRAELDGASSASIGASISSGDAPGRARGRRWWCRLGSTRRSWALGRDAAWLPDGWVGQVEVAPPSGRQER